jgi:putative glutamine amidotransferase
MAFHGSAEQYLRAVREHVDATVITIPGLSPDNAIELLDRLDGVLLTGSFSHVHPSTYGEPVLRAEGFYDPARDRVTLPLIRAALERDMPVFGICRGMQEINVALGGSLSQALQEEPGRADHRPDETLPLAEQFEPAHEIHIDPHGVLASLIARRHISVSTAHVQGVRRLAAGLHVEATTDDGVIEAVSVKGAKSFAVGRVMSSIGRSSGPSARRSGGGLPVVEGHVVQGRRVPEGEPQRGGRPVPWRWRR